MKTRILNRPFYLFLLFSIAVFYFSCKKTDVNTINYVSVKERFFALPNDADPVLQRVVQNLKEQEAKHPFVEHFVKYEGYPIWKNAKITSNIDYNPSSRDNELNTDTTLSVPVVLDSGIYVKDILLVKLNDDILYKLVKGEDYALYGFDTDPNRTNPNAQDIVKTFISFEHEVFASGTFEINDKRLIDSWPDPVKPDNFLLKYTVSIPECEIYVLATSSDGINWYPVWPLQWYWSCTYSDIDISGGWTDEGTTGPWMPIPGGTVGGQTGGTNTPGNQTPPDNIPPCGRGYVRLVLDAATGNWKNPCGGTDVPVPPPTTTPDFDPADPGEDFEYHFDGTTPAINIEDYFRCFDQIADAGATYSISIRVDIPVNNHTDYLVDNSLQPGHSFLTITKTNGSQSITQNIGFYPSNGILSALDISSPGKIIDNGGHIYDESYTMSNVTPAQFLNIKNTALFEADFHYIISSFNCTNFALNVINSIRPNNPIVVPDWHVIAIVNGITYDKNYHQTPNGLYHVLATMPGNSGGTFYASPSHGPCP